MVKRFKSVQKSALTISNLRHLHRHRGRCCTCSSHGRGFAGEPFKNGKNKVFLAHLVFCCNLVAKSVVLALKGQGKGGVVSALKKTQRLCTEKGGKRNINDQQRRLQPGTSQTYHGSNLNQKGQVELSLKLKVHFL